MCALQPAGNVLIKGKKQLNCHKLECRRLMKAAEIVSHLVIQNTTLSKWEHLK